MKSRLRVKPLTDHLTGLQRKIDRIGHTSTTKMLTACIRTILALTTRIDSERNDSGGQSV